MFLRYKSLPIYTMVALSLLCAVSLRCRAAQQAASPDPAATSRVPRPLRERPDSTPLYPQLKEAFLLAQAGKTDEAAAAYRQILEKAIATQDKAAQALAHDGLGLVFYFKAEFPAAKTEGEQALALYQTLQDPASEAQVNNSLGAIADRMGDLASARQYYHKALQSFDAMGDLPMKADLLRNLERSEEPGGEKLLQEALEIALRIGDKQREAGVLHLQADALRRKGEFDAAQDKLSQAALLYQATGDLADLSHVLTSEGVIQRMHGHPERALVFYQQALDLQRKTGDRFGQMQSVNAMGVAYEKMEDPTKAVELYQQALEMARAMGSTRAINFELGNLATVYCEMGRYQEAVTLLEDLVRQGAEDVDYRYQALANAYFHLKRFQDAINAASQAIQGAQVRKNIDVVPNSLIWRARAEDKLDDHTAALADAQESLRVIESERKHLVPSDFMKSGFAEESAEAFDIYVGLLAKTQQSGQALEVAEQARSRAFIDLLATREVEGQRGQQLASLRKVQDQLVAQGIDPNTTSTDPSTETSSLWSQWASADAELRSMVSAQPFSMDQLQATAHRLNSTLVSYWVGVDATYIWVVAADGPVHIATVDVSSKRLQQLIRGLNPGIHPTNNEEQLSAGNRPPSTTPHHLAEGEQQVTTRGGAALVLEGTSHKSWRELYKLLIEPVESWLPVKPGSLLTIEPHGPLLMLSFAALQDKRGRYLLERFSLHYTPAVSLLQFTEKKQRETQQLPPHYLLIADPASTPRDPDAGPLPPLPGARREISAVAHLLPAREVTMLEGSSAAEERISSLLGQSTVIHFATHGIIHDDRPFDSFLALGKSQSDPKEDGRLTAQKIYGLDLHANLVFLSACRSGSGKVSGDGLIGLTRAFWYAGTPSVIASLWDVADEPTHQLVAGFYRWRLAGQDKSRALRLAQLGLLRQLRAGKVLVRTAAGGVTLPEDPIFWAGFVLQGEP